MGYFDVERSSLVKSSVRSDGKLKIPNCFFFWKIDNGQYYFRWPRVASVECRVFWSRVFSLNLTQPVDTHRRVRVSGGVFGVVRSEIRHGRSMRLVVGPFIPARRDNCLHEPLA